MTKPVNLLVSTTSGYSVPLQCSRPVESEASVTVLLLPALGIAARFYQPMAEALAVRGVNTVLFEQRGHGESEFRAGRKVDYGFREWLEEDMPAAIGWIRENLNSEQIALMGHSLGGHLAACYVAMHPQAASHVILTACGSPWVGVHEGKTRRQIKLLCRLLPITNLLFGYFPGDKVGFGGRESRTLMTDWRHLALQGTYHAKGMNVDFESGIAQYPGSVLGIRYEDDPMAPRDAVENVFNKFPQQNVQREVLTTDELGFAADHFKWARRPEVTADRIVNWLAQSRVGE